VLKPDSRRGGKPVPLPAATEPGEIVLERPRLEQLTAAQEAEAVDLLAALFAAAARHRFGHARAGRRQASNRARTLPSWQDPAHLLDGRQERPRDLGKAFAENDAPERRQGQSPRQPGAQALIAAVHYDDEGEALCGPRAATTLRQSAERAGRNLGSGQVVPGDPGGRLPNDRRGRGRLEFAALTVQPSWSQQKTRGTRVARVAWLGDGVNRSNPLGVCQCARTNVRY